MSDRVTMNPYMASDVVDLECLRRQLGAITVCQTRILVYVDPDLHGGHGRRPG